MYLQCVTVNHTTIWSLPVYFPHGVICLCNFNKFTLWNISREVPRSNILAKSTIQNLVKKGWTNRLCCQSEDNDITTVQTSEVVANEVNHNWKSSQKSTWVIPANRSFQNVMSSFCYEQLTNEIYNAGLCFHSGFNLNCLVWYGWTKEQEAGLAWIGLRTVISQTGYRTVSVDTTGSMFDLQMWGSEILLLCGGYVPCFICAIVVGYFKERINKMIMQIKVREENQFVFGKSQI